MDINETRPASYPYYDPFAALLDLDQQRPLPYGWERCVDLKSGWIHFTDRITGEKTDVDPRKQHAPTSHYTVGIPRLNIGSIPTTKYCDLTTTKRSTQWQVAQRGIAVNRCTSEIERTLGFLESTREPSRTREQVCIRNINKDRHHLVQSALSSRASPLCEMQEIPSISEPSTFESVSPSISFMMSTSSSPISALSFWDDEDNTAEINSHSVRIESKNMVEDMASVMVAVGCTGCFMYIMLSKKDLRCPRCGTTSLVDFTTPRGRDQRR